ncbi:hypothetical protein [Burkholderia sp. Bp9031]|uniref:hypothetical protein n=1 Tax=Burkholderia sp. Bp9031 TaxID=2184566 RepID=UPI000F5F1057|nr:hypothetical protein [Burkholderia sp. Bp9031]
MNDVPTPGRLGMTSSPCIVRTIRCAMNSLGSTCCSRILPIDSLRGRGGVAVVVAWTTMSNGDLHRKRRPSSAPSSGSMLSA